MNAQQDAAVALAICNLPIGNRCQNHHMNSWTNVNERLPDGSQLVWIYWRDREVLLGFKVDHDCDPEWGWYSLEDDKCKWTKYWRPIEGSEKMTYAKPNITDVLEPFIPAPPSVSEVPDDAP